MSSVITIHWFRQDLRLADNPALNQALASGTVLPIYILDQYNPGEYTLGAASKAWLHHSLIALNDSLNGNLALYCGNPLEILLELCQRLQVKEVSWNRCYEPWQIKRDTQIKLKLTRHGITVHSYNGSLLWEPWEITKGDGTPYKVFTPFYRKGCLQAQPPRYPLLKPERLKLVGDATSQQISDLNLLPQKKWAKLLCQQWEFGENAANQRLNEFIANGIADYKHGRDYPAQANISRLSPHFHFGEISPNQVWYAAVNSGMNDNSETFCSELGWREFSYSLLYYHPDLAENNLQQKFDSFPWRNDFKHLQAWQQGLTGIPIVDAGMRELWQTGFMHNRVRMIVGSFLVKNLLVDWRHGAQWFWDCLVDADLASNSASWQWVAGCGADAAPYFRIFNPVSQSEKFDPDGQYIRRYVPELAKLPNKFLFAPWQAPQSVLAQAEVILGVTYPQPIVDLKTSREAALKAFQSLKLLNIK